MNYGIPSTANYGSPITDWRGQPAMPTEDSDPSKRADIDQHRTDNDDLIGWAILELLGHRRLAGYVTEQTIAGQAMLRIDVPCDPPATQWYSGAAVYCITPTTEAIARAVATRGRPEPVHLWELPAAPQHYPDEAVPDDAAAEPF